MLCSVDSTQPLTHSFQFQDCFFRHHEATRGGNHLGIRRCWENAGEEYYFGGLYPVFRALILACVICMLEVSKPLVAPLQPIITHRPLELVRLFAITLLL